MFQKILLVLDGSASIVKTIALAVRLAGIHQAHLTGLYIIDSGWRKILGDEWINSETTRCKFYRYMEDKYTLKAQQLLDDIEQKGRAYGLPVNTLVKTGQPHKVLVTIFSDCGPFDLVILPPPQGMFTEGAIKLNAAKVARDLTCPVLIGQV